MGRGGFMFVNGFSPSVSALWSQSLFVFQSAQQAPALTDLQNLRKAFQGLCSHGPLPLALYASSSEEALKLILPETQESRAHADFLRKASGELQNLSRLLEDLIEQSAYPDRLSDTELNAFLEELRMILRSLEEDNRLELAVDEGQKRLAGATEILEIFQALRSLAEETVFHLDEEHQFRILTREEKIESDRQLQRITDYEVQLHRDDALISEARELSEKRTRAVSKEPLDCEELSSIYETAEQLKKRLEQSLKTLPEIPDPNSEELKQKRVAHGQSIGCEIESLNAVILDLKRAESRVPFSVPGPSPLPPRFSTRRFQISRETRPEIIELLLRLDPRIHEKVNLIPEVALLAPDEQVYSLLLELPKMIERHGNNGYLAARELTGTIRFEFTPDLPQRSEALFVVPLASLDSQELQCEFKDVNDFYAFHKFRLYLSLIGINPNASPYFTYFQQENSLLPPSPFSMLRMSFLLQHFSNAATKERLLRSLYRRVSKEAIRRRIEKVSQKKRKDFLLALTGQNMTEEDTRAFTYLWGFSSIADEQTHDEKHQMLDELFGTPVEDLAPDRRLEGGIIKALKSWAENPGFLPTDVLRRKLSQIRLLSTPGGSYLIVDKPSIAAANQFLSDRSGSRSIRTLAGENIKLKAYGLGVHLSDAMAEGRESSNSWHDVLLKRLAVLASTPTPVSDLVFYFMDYTGNDEAISLLNEMLGILIENPETELPHTDLVNRLALWMSARRNTLSKNRAYKDLVKLWTSSKKNP